MSRVEELDTIIIQLDDDLVAWTEKWKIIDLRRKAIVLRESLIRESNDEVINAADKFIAICNEVIKHLDQLK